MITRVRRLRLASSGKPRCRIDDERGPGDDEQIGGERFDLGAARRLDRHRLTKGDRRRLIHPPHSLQTGAVPSRANVVRTSAIS